MSRLAPAPALRHERTVLAFSLLAGLSPCSPALADNAPPLAEITVSATRSERRSDNLPASVTTVQPQAAVQRGAYDLKTLFDDELDVEIPFGPNRYSIAGGKNLRAGNQSINIRGLEGNQVLMMLDGIRLPAGFAFGGFETGRGDYLDLNGLQQGEILRGPASTQYGSDGLAGAVLLRTPEARDWLQDGQTSGGFVRSGYQSVNRSWQRSAGLAGQDENWQGLLQISQQSGHETANLASNDAPDSRRTTPNPADNRSHNLLAKIGRRVDGANQLALTVESFRRDTQTEVYSARALPPLSTRNNTLDLQASDRIARDRVSFKHTYRDAANPWWQRAETQLYWQRAKVSQNSLEQRAFVGPRSRDNAYLDQTVGLSSQLQSQLPGPVAQRLSYGFDWSQSQISSPQNGTMPPAGTVYPGNAFPDTRFSQAGIYLQDEIEFGKLSLIPGMRYDQYRLSPSASSDRPTAALADRAWSPRFGLVWRLTPALAPYAQWARGFRAPTPDQVNLNFSNLTIPGYAYTSRGNPDLRAERANSMELGLRGQLDRLRYTLAYYDNRYDNLISQQVIGGNGASATPYVYQFINLQDARIRGWEARVSWFLDEHWQLKGGVAAARGSARSNGVEQTLASIQPLKTVLTLAYDTARVGAHATLQHAEGRDADGQQVVAQSGGSNPQFSTPAWTTLDIGAYWKFNKALTVNAGINNLFNRQYWRWSDVRNVASNEPALEAWSAPGRNAYLSVRYDF